MKLISVFWKRLAVAIIIIGIIISIQVSIKTYNLPLTVIGRAEKYAQSEFLILLGMAMLWLRAYITDGDE